MKLPEINTVLGKFLFSCLLFLFPFFIYFPSLSYENIYLDDDALTANSSAGIREIFTKDVFLGNGTKSGFYRPLMSLSFAADRKIADFLFSKIFSGKKGAYKYSLKEDYSVPPGMLFVSHFHNILLHGIFCIILCEMFLCFGMNKKTAYSGAALFAALPCNAVAVAWLGGRNDMLLGIFIVPAAIFLKKFLDGAICGKAMPLRYLFAMSLFFLFALFTKETAAAFSVCASVFYIVSMLSFNVAKKKISSNTCLTAKLFISIVIAMALPAAVYFLCRINADLARNSFSHINLYALPRLPYLICGYLFSVHFVCKIPKLLSFILSYVLIPFLLFVPAVFSHIGKYSSVFGLFWFIFFLLPPLLSTDSPEGWFYMRHRLYVPMAGFLMLFLPLLNIFLRKNSSLCLFYAVLSVFLCLNSSIDSRNFKNRLEFSLKQAEENKSRLKYFLCEAGSWHFEHKEYDFSEKYYRKSREAGYETPELSLHLAFIENMKGNTAASFEEIKKGLKKFPDNFYLKENYKIFENYVRH